MKNLNENTVNFKSDSHSVYLVGSGLLKTLPSLMSDYNLHSKSVVLITDKTVYGLYGAAIIRKLKANSIEVSPQILPQKEYGKDFNILTEVLSKILKDPISKNTVLIAIGGGAVTDAGGFIASILLRGVRSVLIPTTLLAMVDASIGGKNGFNLNANGITVKNMIGTFYQPHLVISDTDLLKSLPQHEIKNGYGEIVKYYLAFGKTNLRHLEGGRMDSFQVEKLISECQKIKLSIVKKDPFDRLKIREVLNLGHTVGHAVESISSGRFSHGESVAIGCVAESLISNELGLLSKSKLKNIISVITNANLPISAKNLDVGNLMKVMEFDKKNGRFVLLAGIGKTVIKSEVPKPVIIKVLKEITK